MRFGAIFVLLVLQALADAALAGPWLREKGSGFTSVSFTTTYYLDSDSTSYLEFGLRDDLTIGADIGMSNSRVGEQSGYATLFLRRPLGSDDGPNRWAYELGVGASWVGDLVMPSVKTGLSWGRGFERRQNHGWMAVDAAVIWDLDAGRHLSKLDGTLGLDFSETTTGIVQIYLSHIDDEFYGTLAPSVLIKPRKAKFRIQIGSEIPVRDARNTALKLGIWREF